jgi:hypothetical protein
VTVEAGPASDGVVDSAAMTTHEHEITEAVDLCTPDGRHLDAAAKGWSRHQLHRANLRGWGRTKRWDYWGILTVDGFISLTFADIDYAALVAVEWGEFASGARDGQAHVVPLGRGIELPERSGDVPLRHRSGKIDADVVEVDGGTHLSARWTQKDGRTGELDVVVANPEGHESLNVVVPWSATRFQFTSKHQARPATGTLRVGDVTRSIGADSPAWGTLDVGRGRWPYRTTWNWAGGAGASTDGHVVGIQLGSKWTDGTGATENGIIVDGRLSKIGEELTWRYDFDRPMEPWHVRSAVGDLDLTLTPRFDRASKLSVGVLAQGGHQVFGTWSGTVTHDDGPPLTLSDDVIGFAEEIRSRW